MQVFTLFPPYDDEGYLMMTVKQFLAGRILYDEIYTQYGAVYYFYKWLLYFPLNIPVTHNITRLTTLAVWVLTALLCGLFTNKITKSAIGGAAAYILTFLILFRTAYEPGHPQELCGLLLIVGLLLTAGKNAGIRFDIRIGLLAATLALLFLTKINLGIFLGLAMAIAFVAVSRKNSFRQFLLLGMISLAALLPFILFRKFLFIGWLKLSILVAAALISMLMTNLWKLDTEIIKPKHFSIAGVSFILTAGLILLIVFLQGSTLENVYYGIFAQNLKFGDNFFQPAPIQRFADFWGIFALLLAVGLLLLRRKFNEPLKPFISILKLLFGSAVIFSSFLSYFYFLNVFVLLSFATPFLWVLLLNTNVTETAKRTVFPRILLVVAAILQPLQIFPIAGTQMNYGVFLMLVVAATCLVDGFAELQILLPEIFTKQFVKISAMIFLFLIPAAYGLYRTYVVYRIYQTQIPVKFKGAELLRLPAQDFETYRSLVENLKNNCDNFVTMPGIYSLYFWTETEPPTTFNATAWAVLLNAEQQNAIVEKLKTYPRTCVVYHPAMTNNMLGGENLQAFPLTEYIFDNYQKKAEIGEYQFLIKDD